LALKNDRAATSRRRSTSNASMILLFISLIFLSLGKR